MEIPICFASIILLLSLASGQHSTSKSLQDDGTRTRGLCRDRCEFFRRPTQNEKVTCAVVGNRWRHWVG